LRPALVIIDMLNDFVHGALKTPEAASTVEPPGGSLSTSGRGAGQ